MEQPPSHVGDVINFREVVYAPLNKLGVLLLFGAVLPEHRIRVEEVRQRIPHCIGRRASARGWKKVALACAFKSSELRARTPDLQRCNLILCWEDDWPDCPLEVIELRTTIHELTLAQALAPIPGQLPHTSADRTTVPRVTDLQDLKSTLARQPSHTQYLFRTLDQRIRTLSPTIAAKATRGRYHAGGVSYYATERVFLGINFLKTGHGLALTMFTRGQPIEGVKASSSSLWGYFAVRTEVHLPRAVAIVKSAYEAMQLALQHLEATSKSMVKR
jgi:hypothetical protein